MAFSEDSSALLQISLGPAPRLKRFFFSVVAGRWFFSVLVLFLGAVLGWEIFSFALEKGGTQGAASNFANAPVRRGIALSPSSAQALLKNKSASVQEVTLSEKSALLPPHRERGREKSVPPPVGAVDLASLPLSDQAAAASFSAGESSSKPLTTASLGLEQSSKYLLLSERREALRAAPFSAVSEKTSEGILPKISHDGRKPSDVYKRSIAKEVLFSAAPKVALVLGGMGLNAEMTRQAAERLSPNIAFAFAPHALNLQDQINYVRKQGHEVFLQIPMQQTASQAILEKDAPVLRGDVYQDKNTSKMRELMGRGAGYIGVMNYMGYFFLSQEPAMKVFFETLKKRGLVFLESRQTLNSRSIDLGKKLKVPVLQAGVVIDSDLEQTSILRALESLERKAQEKGGAIGIGTGFGLTIEAVEKWSNEAKKRGVLLVPASAFYGKRSALRAE